MRRALNGQLVLVTGAGGFIGSAVVQALHQANANVRALLGPQNHPAILPPAGVRREHADVRDLVAMCGLTQGVEIVIHAAGPPSVSQSFRSAIEYADVHVGGTVRLLEASRRAGVRLFVHISSAEVYGQPKSPMVSEDAALEPRSPYGAAKAAAEYFVASFSRSFGIDCVILRPFSVYGPRLSEGSLIATLIRQALTAEEVRVNDLRPVRDYCYIDDLARGVLCASGLESVGLSVFNLGTGRGTSVADLARMVTLATSRDVPVTENANQRRSETSEVFRLIADSRQAGELLGWHPTVDLESGLKRTVQAFRSQ